MAEETQRKYDNTTIAALMTLARGGCYAPRCGAPTVRIIDGKPVLNLDIAHIRALKAGGKRYDPSWSLEERNSFANLLLLCNVHHKRVDGVDGEKYTVEILEGWKRVREADGQDALAGLSGLTEARLVKMIQEAQDQYVDRLAPVLGAIAKQVPELSSLLKVLKTDLERTQGRTPGISEDTAWMVYEAGRSLAHLQDNAPLLMEAGDDLAHLQDNVSLLTSAAQALMRLSELPAALDNAADNIRSAAASLSDARRY
ncbi:HNH endonuclease [Streptomyces durhamensis]|uniref:HNH endonuclease n=1 Tax=Streptomyces durhamensis TaxID=68194 RepID=UPI0004CD8455|nr:HNH endonuclease [Streptomyces durhamensis]